METKNSLSSCSNSEEQEIQQLQKQAKTSKEISLNKLNALQSTIQHLSSSNYSMYNKFRDAFQRLFKADERTFKFVLSRNMQNLERKLHKETFHEKDSNSYLHVIKVQFEHFIHSKVLEPSNYNSYDLEIRRDFKEYTQMEAQTFKETIIQNMNSIEQCLENKSNTFRDESSRSRNECNDKSTFGDDTDIRPSYDIEPMVEVPYTAEYNVIVVDTQHSEQPECINNTCVVETGDSNVIPDSPDMCDNDIQNDQNVVECNDERQKFSPNKSSNVYLKTTPPRSSLTWKPTGGIFTQVVLKWIPIRKSVETCHNTNNSDSPLGKETHNAKTVICANSSSLSVGLDPSGSGKAKFTGTITT
nr:hypothetical protein [Tanacetum cinerariifolium]